MPIIPASFTSADELAAREGRTLVYKHSPTCELCGWSNHVLGKMAAQDDVTLELVDVFAQRPLSQAIAAHFGVRHESPQVLVIEDGQVVWHASHRGVAPDRVRAALAGSDAGLGARF
ncbi:MAG TPA: bacillithiol system redox-active protein YtxJ [Gemmatimonadaceae bacterium]|nr:bacillithiol system redox-active protein YtxJ [Gemmatimonadaceae bacterium]HRQ77396.1 bacillithiol system redox-active protein YtxJ [Gemmatimonadaceae bacterium]